MRALADGLYGRLGRADEPHDLRIAKLGMMAKEPQNGVRPVLAAGDGRVFGARLVRISGMNTFDLDSFSR